MENAFLQQTEEKKMEVIFRDAIDNRLKKWYKQPTKEIKTRLSIHRL